MSYVFHCLWIMLCPQICLQDYVPLLVVTFCGLAPAHPQNPPAAKNTEVHRKAKIPGRAAATKKCPPRINRRRLRGAALSALAQDRCYQTLRLPHVRRARAGATGVVQQRVREPVRKRLKSDEVLVPRIARRLVREQKYSSMV